MEHFRLEILGENISFRSHASAERIEEARAFVEEQYTSLKAHGGQLGKDRLLLLLVLGTADNLLQSQRALQQAEACASKLIERIDGHVDRSR